MTARQMDYKDDKNRPQEKRHRAKDIVLYLGVYYVKHNIKHDIGSHEEEWRVLAYYQCQYDLILREATLQVINGRPYYLIKKDGLHFYLCGLSEKGEIVNLPYLEKYAGIGKDI